jgi:cell division septation protein DedD
VQKVGNISDVLAEDEYPLYRQRLITVESGEIPLYRLCIGPFANRYSADRALFKLTQGGLNPGARVFFEPCPD